MSEKILIVDDNALNRKLLSVILGKQGYELLEAVNGAEAVKTAIKELPDIILMDIMMPLVNGYEASSELQKERSTADIPIIFISAKTQPMDKIKGLELGAVDYITKPFDSGEVIARVKNELKISQLVKSLTEANRQLQEKQNKLDEDLKAAALIQKSLIPVRSPELEKFEFTWQFTPCDRIGGDLFNLLPLDDRHLAAYVLDVSGHGVPAAMVTVSVSQMFLPEKGLILKKGIFPQNPDDIVTPAMVLQKLDREFPIERFDRHFTISYLILNTEEGSVRYSNAAHPQPIILRSDGRCEFLHKGGSVIGLGKLGVPFEEGQTLMRPGDRLFMYTDGILEYRNPENEHFGKERFIETLESLRAHSLEEIPERLMASLMNYGKFMPPQDDITFLGIEFKG